MFKYKIGRFYFIFSVRSNGRVYDRNHWTSICDTNPLRCRDRSLVLYTNIDLKLRNKSHGPMYYKIGVTCVYNGHVFNTLL